MMSGSMIDVMRGISGPPDKSGGYRMIDGITCVKGVLSSPDSSGGQAIFMM